MSGANAEKAWEMLGTEGCVVADEPLNGYFFSFSCGLTVSRELVEQGIEPGASKAAKQAHWLHHVTCMAVAPKPHGDTWGLWMKEVDDHGLVHYEGACP